jgi:hypothetical protein
MFGIKNFLLFQKIFLINYNHNPVDSLNYCATIIHNMATQPVKPWEECKFSAEFLISGGDRLCVGEFCINCQDHNVECKVAWHPSERVLAGKSIKLIAPTGKPLFGIFSL